MIIEVIVLIAMSVAPQEVAHASPAPEADPLARERSLFASLTDSARELPPDYARYWEAARAGATLGAALGNTDEARTVLRSALGLADQAIALREDGVDARYWAAASAGLLADVEGGRSKMRAAERAWLESERVLALDSLHAGAHHIQGRLHAAVMRLGWLQRTLAKHLLGADLLGHASWPEAERHLRLAAELAPDEPAYHFELALALRDRGRPEEARRSFEAALAAPTSRPADEAYKARARAALEAGP